MSAPAQDLAENLWIEHARDPAAVYTRAQARLADPCVSPEERPWLDLTLGYHQLFFGEPQSAARAWLASAAAGFRGSGNTRGEVIAGTGLSRLLVLEGSPERARDELLALDPKLIEGLAPGDRFWVLDTLGAACFCGQRIDEAIRYFHEALESLRSIDVTPQLPLVMSELAAALVSLGDYAPACELAWDAIGLLKHYENPQLLLAARSTLAEALFENNDPAGALAVVEAIMREADWAAVASAQNHSWTVAAEVLAREGRIDDARTCATRARQIREQSPGGFNDVHAAWAAAVVADAGSDPERAARALEQALEAATQFKHLPTLAKSAERAALRCAQLRDYERAYHYQRVFSQALGERLTSRAGVKYYLLKVQHELKHARAERDRAQCERQESAAVNRQLEHLNNELTQRMREIVRLQARLAAEAVRDPLTDLFNRRYLDMVLPGLLAAAARRGTAISVALIDLDHFKRVNDRHGHPVGDRVLTAIGHLFSHSLRPSDMSCRYGGEEFCIVLPDTTAQGARRAIENLAERLRGLVLDAGDGMQIGHFTFSAGIAEYPIHGRSVPELIAAADRALYAAKAGGRDQVLLAPAAARQAS